MDNGDNDIKHYSAEDITRYWQGKLSPQEMHAMEMAAMDDPFLADAMEGYSGANAATVGAEVHELQTRLKERTSGATVVPLRKKNKWWAVAALLILLCGFGAWMYNLFLQTNAPAKQATAEVNKTDADAVADKKDTAVATIVSSDTIQSLTFANVDSTNNTGYATFSKPAAKDARWSGGFDDKAAQPANVSSGYSTSVPKSSQISDTVQIIARAEDETAKRARKVEELFKESSRNDSPVLAQNDSRRNSPAESLQGRAAGVNVQRNNAVGPPTSPVNREVSRDNEQYRQQQQRFFNNFSGRVLDRNNEPIANATVGISNTTATTTDQNGNFKIRSYDTVLDLSVTSVGYETARLVAKNNQPVDVVLNESNSKLSEVVVTGMGAKKEKKTRVSGSTELRVFVIDAEPVGGWDEYNKYIETNKRVGPLPPALSKPAPLKDNKDSTAAPAKNEVVVSFMISKTGKLSNFVIEKSLGTQRDAEAIRLITEGPAWRVLKNKKTKARVIIPF